VHAHFRAATRRINRRMEEPGPMWVYPEIRTLGGILNYWGRHEPGRLAMRWNGRSIDFATFDRVSNQVAHWLIGEQVSRDERVGFFGRNSADFYFAMFGTAKTAGCFTPLNWRLTASEIAVLIEDSGLRLAIVDEDLIGLWDEACQAAGLSVSTVKIDAQSTLEDHVSAQPDSRPDLTISEDDCAIQLYTSGTTGRPKGVMLTHGGFNRMRLCEHLEPAYDWHPGDSFLCALPNFHLLHIGIAVQCLYNGVSITPVRQFEPGAVLAAIAQSRPTLLTLTPTMIQMLLDHPEAETTDFSCLRLMLYAGSAISLGLIKRALLQMPCQFMQFYGATEANGAFSLLRPEEHDLTSEQKLQSCGRPLPLIAFKVVTPEGETAAIGKPGELLVRSPAITAGYWRQPGATSAALSDGWYRTGDVAYVDDQGLYYIVDRVKDMIVSGGENIYSAEVENVLSTHPAVAAVAVIGVPDPRWGEAVKAIIIRKAGETCSEADLLAYCRARLAAYKTPKSVDYVDAFPLVPSGKVSKKDLRARYWSGEQRHIA
jgi:acyl-CoA synthetase (AMP-forming)/AMP-acid ligase II